MRPHIFIAIAAAMGLSGCAPEGYSRSSAVADQFKQALGSRTHAGVSTVALCTIEGQKAVSVLLDGGEFYHYVVGEVGADGIAFMVYDQNGEERDRFTLP